MMKKITAISFLTLATLLMLAATVVPHHHHHESICFNNIHCEHDPAEEHHHHHDDEPFRSGHCCLEYLFQTQVSRMQDSEHAHCKGLCPHFAQTLFIVPDSSLLPFRTIGQASPHTVYRERQYGFIPISDLSGRAPPFLIG